ncbi:sulfotransferase [Profundibacterium mesophilum]|uniref:Deacetylase sulfotransferase n=1 Tax=Profundibacterium mesophilum KAUST100406-0324 TaxID=1037889 RepID=A0A921NNE8_9RHOB|nr:sulfotransferase [Profundibacterium mesophilum]KAF0674871.1 putative deacetylase sulfotransferase [Profundibacterium mesophilum KAUST100406-0324]
MDDLRVAYCVGATKAGTSWLHRYLSDHPDCHLRSVKELHYFDTLEAGRTAREAERHAIRWEMLERELSQASRPQRRATLERHIADARELSALFAQAGQGGAGDGRYLDYLARGRGDRGLLADITPAYALLPEARLRQMAALAPQTRFVYLLRDPVARLWSHVRMMAARRAAAPSEVPQRARNILARVLRGGEEQIEIRSQYGAALRRLTAALEPDRLLCVFYEDMFGGDALSRICGFLGIRARPADFSRRIHEGPTLDPGAEALAQMRAHLADQYDAVAAHMGRLPQAWLANIHPPAGRSNAMKV